MDASIRVGLLGPLELHVAGRPVRLRGTKERTVLAALALAPGRSVPVPALTRVLWADPPPTAHRLVLNTLSGLRRHLGPAVVTTSGGYALDPARVRVDAAEFEARCAEAGDAAAAGRPGPAADLLRAALACWRGPALGGVPGLAGEAARLEERRLAALEERVECDLELGRHAAVLGELTGLVAEHPLRERSRAQLIMALHGCGRPAEALATYRAGRQRLVEELGLEPGPELRRAEQAVLAGEPTPTPASTAASTAASASASASASGSLALGGSAPAGPAGSAGSAGSRAVPSQLPAGLRVLTGRDRHLAELDRLLAAGTPAVTVVGPPGVGKTTLAVHWARRVADRFPDGRLYADLRGFDRTGVAAEPDLVLRDFLDALGHPARPAPGRWRAATAACSPGAGCWSCWTTRGTRSRSGRCSRPATAASPS